MKVNNASVDRPGQPTPTEHRHDHPDAGPPAAPIKLCALAPQQLAVLFHQLATARSTSWEQWFARLDDMDAVSAEMARRGLPLEDPNPSTPT